MYACKRQLQKQKVLFKHETVCDALRLILELSSVLTERRPLDMLIWKVPGSLSSAGAGSSFSLSVGYGGRRMIYTCVRKMKGKGKIKSCSTVSCVERHWAWGRRGVLERKRLRPVAWEARTDAVQSLRMPEGLGSRAQVKRQSWQTRGAHRMHRGSHWGETLRVLLSVSQSKSSIECEAGGVDLEPWEKWERFGPVTEGVGQAAKKKGREGLLPSHSSLDRTRE